MKTQLYFSFLSGLFFLTSSYAAPPSYNFFFYANGESKDEVKTKEAQPSLATPSTLSAKKDEGVGESNGRWDFSLVSLYNDFSTEADPSTRDAFPVKQKTLSLGLEGKNLNSNLSFFLAYSRGQLDTKTTGQRSSDLNMRTHGLNAGFKWAHNLFSRLNFYTQVDYLHLVNLNKVINSLYDTYNVKLKDYGLHSSFGLEIARSELTYGIGFGIGERRYSLNKKRQDGQNSTDSFKYRPKGLRAHLAYNF